MTSPFTITLSDKSSVLQSYFLPKITFDENCDYSCAFLDLIIKTKQTDDLKKIVDLEILRINCDIIFGSYINGERRHAIHQFATSRSHMKDNILVEIPKNLVYFPIKTKHFHSIQISIVDKDGKLIPVSDGEIICRVNIKREPNLT